MSTQELVYVIDLGGTLVFAISGWLAASKKQMDPFGASVIAFITAVGGGTLRDLLIGSQPVGWMVDQNYLLMIGCGIGLGYLFKRYLEKLRKTMFLFDSIGIGLFTILGIEKTLSFGLTPVIAVMMGTVSAVFGGVLRDTLANEVPLIFRQEIYATACLTGGILFLILGYFNVNVDVRIILTVVYIIALRIVSVKYKWSFPTIK
ncbi:trimeric intracellular cation channel family protein [uncultured Roseivirga sp.]|uniref:trimeric intracellular cation channel family protein n=1 Tax=uncultured Roseivirga sp. TaxID=543088 RepID=UPI0030DD3DBE|tara:strand:+ start:60752 stop:61363 length:612 start_codon:yes stop_codon:yes gene_type:complete